jgi:hypothetical protein
LLITSATGGQSWPTIPKIRTRPLSPLDDGTGLPFEIHAWTETDAQPSTFADEQTTDHGCTINMFGCGHSPIVVGAYRPLQPESKLETSGEGPTRDGKLKPEVSAPGEGITVVLQRIFCRN